MKRRNELLNSHWLVTFFEVFNRKKLVHMKKFAGGKQTLRSSISTRILWISSKYPLHPAFNFGAMKWRWMNFELQVAYSRISSLILSSLLVLLIKLCLRKFLWPVFTTIIEYRPISEKVKLRISFFPCRFFWKDLIVLS